jgi:hypothetical protein
MKNIVEGVCAKGSVKGDIRANSLHLQEIIPNKFALLGIKKKGENLY